MGAKMRGLQEASGRDAAGAGLVGLAVFTDSCLKDTFVPCKNGLRENNSSSPRGLLSASKAAASSLLCHPHQHTPYSQSLGGIVKCQPPAIS